MRSLSWAFRGREPRLRGATDDSVLRERAVVANHAQFVANRVHVLNAYMPGRRLSSRATACVNSFARLIFNNFPWSHNDRDVGGAAVNSIVVEHPTPIGFVQGFLWPDMKPRAETQIEAYLPEVEVMCDAPFFDMMLDIFGVPQHRTCNKFDGGAAFCAVLQVFHAAYALSRQEVLFGCLDRRKPRIGIVAAYSAQVSIGMVWHVILASHWGHWFSRQLEGLEVYVGED